MELMNGKEIHETEESYDKNELIDHCSVWHTYYETPNKKVRSTMD